MVPSSEIPSLLKNIFRCLAPRGVLHLAVIDPAPVTSTLGPHMRAWLENHLMLNLEKSFRCVSPSKLFPIWLADTHLRGSGSGIIKMKFRAVPTALPAQRNSHISIFAESEEKRTKTELRSIVGRMLWQEVWGEVRHRRHVVVGRCCVRSRVHSSWHTLGIQSHRGCKGF